MQPNVSQEGRATEGRASCWGVKQGAGGPPLPALGVVVGTAAAQTLHL